MSDRPTDHTGLEPSGQRSHRLVGMGIALALLAGVAGFVVGYRGRDHGQAIATSPSGGAAARPRSFDAASTGDAADNGATPTAPPSGSSSGPAARTLLVRRAAADGTELRGWDQTEITKARLDSAGVVPPECRIEHAVSVDASTNDLVAPIQTVLTAAHRDDAALGWAGDDRGGIVVLVVAAADGTTVRATFPHGATDTATAQRGFAILAAAQPPFVESPSTTADHPAELAAATTAVATSPGGGRRTLRVSAATVPSDAAACQGTMPSPGATQPERPDEARSEVNTLVSRLVYAIEANDGRALPALVDDVAGIDTTEPGRTVTPGVLTVTVAEVVFTDDTHGVARILVTSKLAEGDESTPFLLGVRRVDGAWKLTRQSFCQSFGAALATCGQLGTDVVRPAPSVTAPND